MGECKRCNYCCEYITLVMEDGGETEEWAKARGYEKRVHNGLFALYALKHPCSHLVNGGCDLHGTDKKPKACVKYPSYMKDYTKRYKLSFNGLLGKDCGYRE